MMATQVLARGLAIIGLAGLVALADWTLRPIDLTLPPPAPLDHAPNGAVPPGETDGPGGTTDPGEAPNPQDAAPENALGTDITTEQAYMLYETGEVVFVDARAAADYDAGHIAGAFLVPPTSLDKGRVGELMEAAGIDGSVRVVVYCEGGTCDASKLVALYMRDAGFTSIHIDVDGFAAWEAAGLPVEAGPDALLGDPP